MVSTKTNEPFSNLNIEKIAKMAGFEKKHEIKFNLDMYPYYENRKGMG